MTRKDYVLIADAIRAGRYEGMDAIRTAIHNDYAQRICDALAADNPKFDRARFMEACGV